MDWAERRAAYDASSIDWGRLRTYAARVAGELRARDPQSGDWLLDRRHWTKTEKNRHFTEVSTTRTSYLLTTGGELVGEIESWTEHHSPGWSTTPHETRRFPLDEWAVTLFDFDRRNHRSRSGAVEVEANDGRSEKLLVRAKGVGLSMRLKKLLDG
ncbi:hypothetical protein [Rathayibacter oskolensis]|uniref:hypothetical protein n=1 Tax=Rathayibacter oskolensis TaxID=1891671 RepID=UPI00101AD863|nr:hypothetical protein [Rathayibacter oskolensis]